MFYSTESKYYSTAGVKYTPEKEFKYWSIFYSIIFALGVILTPFLLH